MFAQSHDQELQLQPQAGRECPKCGCEIDDGAVVCIDCGYNLSSGAKLKTTTSGPPATSSTRGTKATRPGRSLGAIKSLGGFPLVAGAGFGSAILGGMLWGAITKWTHFEFGMLAWAIGLLVGFSMMIFTDRRSVGLGVLASFFAVMGICSGKYFVAKWYIIPMWQQEVQDEDSDFNQEFEKGFSEGIAKGIALSEKDISEFMIDSDYMFDVGCWYLDNQGVWDDYDVQYDGEFAGLLPSYNAGWMEPPTKRAEVVKTEMKRVRNLVGNWSVEQKRTQILARHEEQTAEMQKVVEGFSDVAQEAMNTGFGTFIAFLATFSFFDILWFLMAIGSAYKLASGGYED